MQFIKTRDVKDPIRNVKENAGIDVFIPENSPKFTEDLVAKNPGLKLRTSKTYSFFENGVIHIAPHRDIIIPSGIRSKFSPNMALIANNKSGIATKKKLVFGASVIDASYQGEWHLHLINTSDEFQTIDCGMKALQFIPYLISTEEVEVLDETPEEFYTETTSRGEGWAGSTGIN